MTSEFEAIDQIRSKHGRAAPGEIGIGDDAAYLRWPATGVLAAADAMVDGVHFDRALSTLADVGWKAVTVNVSDIGAMGGRTTDLLITVAGASPDEIAEIYEGVAGACARYGCRVVGGDLSSSPTLVISVTALGSCDGSPVSRSGARPGDAVVVTGPLGAAAAELGAWRADPTPTRARAARNHRRPIARDDMGRAAAAAGATAMIDVSDGFAADLFHILDESASGVELTHVPVADGAAEADAIGGGDDYELIVVGPDGDALAEAIAGAGGSPAVVGRIHGDAEVRTIAGTPLEAAGWSHPLG